MYYNLFMSNVHLHIFGSKVFYELINELGLEYKINFIQHENLYTEEDSSKKIIRIIFPEKLKLLEIKNLIKQNIPTVFLLNNKDYLTKNSFNLLDFHINLSLPIEILSFIEILKILLTKYNFFKKSKIIVSSYEIDSNQRTIRKDGAKLKLTEKELALIFALNEKKGISKSILLKKVWNYNTDLDSHAFETLLHRLRKKIEKSFKDNQFIIEKNSLYYLFSS